ncbi:MAG TPA: DUF1622 domain-containing protein [Methanothrix sp.]|jgi:uncharacterized membrane protein|nr:DUF1622 domain-containing protein [Methanothrix sp.]
MNYISVIDAIGLFLSSFGAAIIFFAGIGAIIKILAKEIGRRILDYNAIRTDFTSKIMLGLEFFIAGDLMKTILTPGLDQVIILAIIVAIRTVVGYSLNQEIKNG